MDAMPGLVYTTPEEQHELLESVLGAEEAEGEIGSDVQRVGDNLQVTNSDDNGRMAPVQKRRSNQARQSAASERHSLFVKRDKERASAR